jgi:flavodoxin
MKSAIIYYSYGGNTQKVANVLWELLREKGEAHQIELVAQDESQSFLMQCKRALLRKQAKIQPVNTDLSNYDLICLGTPVWAFAPTPAMNTYLERSSGLTNKPVVLFATFGSGSGLTKCLDYMEKILAKKGVKQFSRFSVQQFKVNDKEFIKKTIFDNLKL